MRVLLVVGLVGCGRVGFDAVTRDDGGARPDVTLATCTPGATLQGTRVINASLSDPSDACNVERALVADGVGAGLDRSYATLCPPTWDPADGSCGCVAIDLGAVYPLARIDMIARPIPLACTYACIGATCGTGDSYAVLAGVFEGEYARVGDVQMAGTAFAPYAVVTPLDARYLVMCRVSYGEQRDDIEIDAVTAVCR